jgi:hypothetical protein
MKQIIIVRSLRVALVLAILCASAYLTLFRSPWFAILVLASIFFMDVVHSMLVWRLKLIENPQLRKFLIYVYLIISLISLLMSVYAFMIRDNLNLTDLKTFMWITYSILVVIFSFQYFLIVVKVMAVYSDE